MQLSVFTLPHYNKAGVFIDPCLWCGKNRCKRAHGTIGPGDEFDLFEINDDEAISELLNLRPEHMGIEEHRLKFHFQRLVKTMSQAEAWEAAKEETIKDRKRAKHIFPTFSKQETRNIQHYKPTNPVIDE